jgi:hypothetical protein
VSAGTEHPGAMSPSPAPRVRRRRRARSVTAALVALATGLLAAVAAWGYYHYFPSDLGPEQPIPFSHRVHVTDKHISCILCHNGVASAENAGIPPLETCMLCHSKIIIDHPKIKILREHWFAGEPVQWARVNVMQEFVYFTHEVHVRAGFDCSRCHGNVPQMDRVVASPELTMGFCRDCHTEQNFSHDCLICHR